MESSGGEAYPSGSYEEDSPLSSYIPSNQQRQRRNREELPGSHEALQAAQEYQQHLAKKSRSTIKVLNQCCVSGTYVMTLPSNYCKKMMPHGRAEVIVRDRSGHQWRMRWNWTVQPVIGAGWKAFCVHHELVKGDVLVFQKENSSEMITFRVEIFKRRKLVKSSDRANAANIVLLPPKKEPDALEIEIEELGGVANGGDVHDYDVLERNPKRTRGLLRGEWVENSHSCNQEVAGEEEEGVAEGMGGGEEAAEERQQQRHEPVVALVLKKTRSAAESEELGMSFKMQGSKLQRMCRSVLGSPGSIVEGSSAGSLKAKVSKEELRKILNLAFPLYDATPF
ncbi:uncharacterized protein LOC9640612 [Selaginella moellendorffii]|uniref:uncharacterized protein LOC9640612 n=1 Tax=Selaginella moellendorffii TaxID=88036 RepID=UPI000D1C2FD6|nr:uncharacterized protein LOC9640612 [Selaginella moellendorffii]|eukprot:XP_024532707.1 uncharacterized protein LOC9640612 [Selaginella moellendorffii]